MKKFIIVITTHVLLCWFCVGVWAERLESTVNSTTSPTAAGESIADFIMNQANPWTGLLRQCNLYRDTTELYWDDGTPETYYQVSGIPGIYDRFAVRFNIAGPLPMKVAGGRFYTDNSVIALQSFSVCPDADGYPDVFHPIDQVNTVYGGSPGWSMYDFHGAIFDTGSIWVVVHWIPGYVVGIGADSTLPDGHSFWCNEKAATNWNLWTATDWMMRLSVATVTDSHDVTTTAILEPPVRFLPGDTAYPTAVFGNCGLAPETFDITFDILDSTSSVIYTSTNTITLVSAEVETLVFTPEWVGIDEGTYTFVAYTSLVGDADPANDTVQVQGLCTREIIITYCGDYTNMGFSIIGSWASNRKFLDRMTPPIAPPFYLRRAEIFLCNNNTPMEYIYICPDNGSGLPDTTTVLASAFNISVPVSWTWATANFGDMLVTDSCDLWMIAKWPEGITEPHIGAETYPTVTGRSWRYYFRSGVGTYQCMGVDPYFREWYFRLIVVVPETGIEEVVSMNRDALGLMCSPNPGRDNIMISFAGSLSAGADLAICDVTGRVVRTLLMDQCNLNNSMRSVYWDGTDNRGLRLPAGIYFVHLQISNCEEIIKVVLLK